MSAAALSLLSFLFTAAGAALGMFGAFKQANAYYPFRLKEFPEHIARVVAALRHGRQTALKQVEASAELGQLRGEDRAQSLIGLYCLFCGFFLQMAGALFALLAALAAGVW